MCERCYVTEANRDPRKMHRRIGKIIAKQLRVLEKEQRKNHDRGLGITGTRLLKSLNDALDDHVRLGRQLDEWDEEAAETLTDQELESLADGKKPATKRETKQ